jgi:hypothetical protein
MGGETSKMMAEGKKWFNSLSEENQLKITKACRLYAYHFDGYINTIYKETTYPYAQLIDRGMFVYDVRNNFFFNGIFYDEFDNTRFCNESTLENPFYVFNNKKSIKLSELVKTIEKVTFEMHNVFTDKNLSFVLQEPIEVYRGLKLDKDKEVSFQVRGITSVASELQGALNFAFSGTVDGRYDKSVILKITLPKGTRIIPMNICTLQNEYEIIIISQGEFVKTKPSLLVYEEMWNDFVSLEGDYIKGNTGGQLPYELIEVEFVKKQEFPVYKKFKVSPTLYPTIVEDLEETKENNEESKQDGERQKSPHKKKKSRITMKRK